VTVISFPPPFHPRSLVADNALGEIGCREGPMMAFSDKFRIDVKGIGGHGAHPQGTVDAIVEAAALVTALQTVVSRNMVSPSTLSPHSSSRLLTPPLVSSLLLSSPHSSSRLLTPPLVSSLLFSSRLSSLVSSPLCPHPLQDPLQSGVLTCGTIQGGYANNIIADHVAITGTARAFTTDVQVTFPLPSSRLSHCHRT
jgi:acetylornithine deacetylase/succinyl-diaminopimelate desuccinylase-like protein